MKTRARDRHSAKNQPDSQNRPSGEGACFEEQSSLKSSGKTSDSSVLSDQPQSITSTTSVLADSKQHQDITCTCSVLTSTSEAQSIHSALSYPSFAGVMAERQSPSRNRLEPSASAAEQAVCGLVQSSTQSRQTSPVHLTELVSSTVGKTDCTLSDKNHNLPPMYVVTSQPLQCSTPSPYFVKAEGKVGGFSDPSMVGNAVFATNYYYHNSNEGKKMDISSSTHYSISPESCVYPKDSLYPPQYSFDTQTCKVFSFCSMDTGREYSPPEMTTYNTSTSYTSPLTSSITSSGSPETVHWSPDSTHVLPSDACLPKSTAGQPVLPLQEALPDTGKSVSEAHSSIHIAYYSDEQSLGEDSMQDIKQDILTSDIHKHIYQNFSQNLTLSSLDEESHDHFEDLSPGRGGSSGKSGSSSKKRRRRTQTPIQRKAANMRERKRMCHLNTAFNCLKDRLPNVRSRKKLSRIQTLKAAIFYIGLLTECLQTS